MHWSTHSLYDNRVQQAILDYLRGQDVSQVKIGFPTLRFTDIPDRKGPSR